MEVVEHVDNPAGFLRSCAELVKVCPARPLIISSTLLFSFFLSSGLLARRTSFPLDDRTDAALLSSFDRSRREGASPRRTWNAYLFKIRQSRGAHRFLHQASRAGCTSLDFPDICAWPSDASRGRGARHCLCSVAW